jgi:hypothetical protein
MCCGQKRAELRGRPTLRTTPNLAQSIPGNVGTRTRFTPAPVVATRVNPAPSLVSAPPHMRQYPTTIGSSGFQPTINLRYIERSPIQVRGPITGRMYEFSPSQPIQPIDARDVATLLRTRFFLRA